MSDYTKAADNVIGQLRLLSLYPDHKSVASTNSNSALSALKLYLLYGIEATQTIIPANKSTKDSFRIALTSYMGDGQGHPLGNPKHFLASLHNLEEWLESDGMDPISQDLANQVFNFCFAVLHAEKILKRKSESA